MSKKVIMARRIMIVKSMIIARWTMMPRRTMIARSMITIRMTLCITMCITMCRTVRMTNLRFTQIIKAIKNVRIVINARNMRDKRIRTKRDE